MSTALRANITGRFCGRQLRVSGAQHISAVVVVTLQTQLRSPMPGVKRTANAVLFLNPQAQHPLGEGETHLLECLDFNSFEWGAGWEAWQAPRGTKKADNTSISRVRRQGGSVIMHGSDTTGFAIEVPAHIIARLLANDISNEEMVTLCSKYCVQRCGLALEKGQEIIGCEYVPCGRESRGYPRILLRYGPPKSPVIADPNKRGGRVPDDKGATHQLVIRWVCGFWDYVRGRLRR